MSVKKLDSKGRMRTETISFRASKAERKEIDDRVKLCGYLSKQDYILSSLLYQKVNAQGNPLMLVKFRQHLEAICKELQRLKSVDEIDEELFTPIRTMLDILKSFDKSNC